MTSILTNTSATVTLSTLRAINGQLDRNQHEVSTGYRVATASDNAAYWSISTTMRSDAGAKSAAQDAMAFGAAKIDTAYAGIEATIGVVDAFKSKIIAAMESGIDRTTFREDSNNVGFDLKDFSVS